MRILNILLVGIALYCLNSCAEKNPMVGQWKADDIDVKSLKAMVPAEEWSNFESEVKMNFKKSKFSLTFQEDSKMIVETELPGSKKMDIQKGTWSLSKDKKTLKAKVDKITIEYTVVENTDEKLVLKMSDKTAMPGVIYSFKH